jgi:hypothetical protein
MYWRLLSNNPAAARDIVLAEKPVISTETDRMDKGMLDQVGYPLDEIPAVKLTPRSCCCTPAPWGVSTTRTQMCVVSHSHFLRLRRYPADLS